MTLTGSTHGNVIMRFFVFLIPFLETIAMAEGKNELVQMDQRQSLPAKTADPLNILANDELGGEYWTTLDVRKPEDRFAVDEAMGPDVDDVSKWINKIFPAVHIVTHQFRKINEADGEIIVGIRVVLIGPKGEMVAWTSGGASKSIRRIAQSWGTPPWQPPLPLRFMEVKVSGTKRTYVIQVDRESWERSQAQPSLKPDKKTPDKV